MHVRLGHRNRLKSCNAQWLVNTASKPLHDKFVCRHQYSAERISDLIDQIRSRIALFDSSRWRRKRLEIAFDLQPSPLYQLPDLPVTAASAAPAAVKAATATLESATSAMESTNGDRCST